MRQIVFETLEKLGIPYELQEHPAAFTMEEIEMLGIDRDGNIVKNLFLRDAKGKRHFLVVVNGEKQINLKSLSEKLDSSRLSFASEERLAKYLKLTKGSVSPFGILNDDERAVVLVFDKDLQNLHDIGVHPNDNTATVWLSFSDLLKVVQDHKTPVTYVQL